MGGETRHFQESGLYGPAAIGFHPTPEGCVGTHLRQAPAINVAAVFYLREGVDAIVFVAEDEIANHVAIAVDVAPAATLQRLRVDVVVFTGELANHGILRLDDPTAKVVHNTPLVGVFRVGDRDAPCVVVSAYYPLVTGFFGIFHVLEDVFDNHYSLGIDTAPTTLQFHGSETHGVGAEILACAFVHGFIFPLSVVVDKSPFVVGGVLGGIDPFSGFFGGVPLVAGLLGFLLGAEDVADNHVAGLIYAAPAAIIFHHGKFSFLVLESKGHLVSWWYLPDAIAVFVAIFHADVVEGQRLCQSIACQHEGNSQCKDVSFHIRTISKLQRYMFFFN